MRVRLVAASDLPPRVALDDDLLVHGDNLDVLPRLPDGAFDLIYIDPPFNTGREQRRASLRVVADDGRRSRRASAAAATARRRSASLAYADAFDDYVGFLAPRLRARAPRCSPTTARSTSTSTRARATTSRSTSTASSAASASSTSSSGPTTTAAKPRRRWPPKHDTILVYVKDPGGYHFDDRRGRPRARTWRPGSSAPEKAARGKRPTDAWWHTIVPTNGRERTGYPTQKPEGVVRRIVAASSRPGGWCLDFFAGLGHARRGRARARAGASCSSTPSRGDRRHVAAPGRRRSTTRCRCPGCSSRPRPSWRSGCRTARRR